MVMLQPCALLATCWGGAATVTAAACRHLLALTLWQ